jgi:hypothetical protein
MALDVYFRDDIAQSIATVAVAMLSAAVAHGGTNSEYCRGVLDSARAQALNHGIPWAALSDEIHGALSDAARGELLEMLARALPEG